MTTPELNKALAAFQANLPAIAKGETGKVEGVTKQGKPFSYEYQYADLADVSDAVMPLLGKYGLAFTAWPILNAAGQFVVAYTLTHESGEERAAEFPLYLLLPERVTPQQFGGFLTYIRRYLLCCVTGVAPGGEDDDAHAAEQAAAAVERKPRQQRQRATPAPAPPSPDGPLGGQAGSVTEPQLKKLGAQFSGMGFTNAERVERLAAAGKIVGRDLGSASDLSKAEASKLIDVLERCGTRDNLMVLLATGELPGGDTNG